ncbi:Cysteine-rich repeat secretory protein 38 [Morella rubra]|uniref:Cysteine-rich repeat secretory protein 38 n=1 Tax=Morella rubra TaxID=262757 RepID=A0A6A1WD97_9ROSI|nr:Cysteine-rich repeat secretory protein 38 [Morella rubra]
MVALMLLCPNQKEATGWYDQCSLRFSACSMFGIGQSMPNFVMYNARNVSDIDGYSEALEKLLDNITNEVASGTRFSKGCDNINSRPRLKHDICDCLGFV